jgi:DNA repair exonuclease SbcCD ATPase subunit
MANNSGKGRPNLRLAAAQVKFEDEIDALFKLPLAEFTGARNALAARLKQSGRANDAQLVKALAKPPISAWAVNQLYWKHHKAFEGLVAEGKRVRQAQTSGKVTDLRASLDARREALSQLSDLASSLLRQAGHNPGLDTIRRITTTLEGVSVSLPDGPTPGRLTQDVDPPGFDSLASMFAGAVTTRAIKEQKQPAAEQKSISAASSTRPKATPARDAHQEEMRRARIAAAKITLQSAKRALTDARVRAQRIDAVQKKVSAEAKEAEKRRREAEAQLKKLKAAWEAAAERAQSITAEAREAAEAVEDARRTIEKASKELESLFAAAPK